MSTLLYVKKVTVMTNDDEFLDSINKIKGEARDTTHQDSTQVKEKIDMGKLADKVANSAGKYARKGVDFIGSILNPDNIRKVGEQVKNVAQSASQGWKDAGKEDAHNFDDVKDTVKNTARKVGDKINDVTGRIKNKIDENAPLNHDAPVEEPVEVETEEATIVVTPEQEDDTTESPED